LTLDFCVAALAMTSRHTGVRPLQLDGLLEQPIAAGTKGLPLRAAGLRLREIGQQGWNLLAGDGAAGQRFASQLGNDVGLCANADPDGNNIEAVLREI
jgi:hypothetical protein